MKKVFLPVLLVCILFISCKKNSATSDGDEITLEAKATSGSFSQITYLDEGASQTILSNVANNWKITFKNKAAKPRQVVLTAVSNVTSTPQPNITLNIYLNGTIVKTGSVGVGGFIQYTLN